MKYLSLETRKKISETLKRKGIHPPPGSHLGHKHKKETIQLMSNLKTGELNPCWKGDDVKYSGIHVWLRKTYGKPLFCEHCLRIDKKKYEWARITGKNYERKRENFIRLCRSCHLKYDYAGGERKYVQNKNKLGG